MKRICLQIVSIIIALSFCACLPVIQNKKQLKNLREAEKQLEIVQAQRQAGEQENTELQSRLAESNKELEACKTVNENITSTLLKLSDRSRKLNEEVQRQQSVLALQEQVIKLLDDTKRTIESSLKDQISAQQIKIQETDDELKVILLEQILFDSGSVEIKKEGGNLLLTLAETFRKHKTHQIIVQGYADNVPLGASLGKLYPSNWELSASRAAAVVRFLQVKGGVDPKRLSLKAYGSYHPIASNDTVEGRAQNRRIEIILDVSH